MKCKGFKISTVAVYDCVMNIINKSGFPMIFDFFMAVGVEITVC